MSMFYNLFSRHELSLRDEQNDIVEEKMFDICWGCRIVTPRSSPIYICSKTECISCRFNGKFVLHKKCAELPTEIKHPMHQHSLLQLQTYAVIYVCHVCEHKQDSYGYRCCDFWFCMRCATMEPVLVHQGHEHSLSLVYRQTLSRCDACGTKAEDFCYHCVLCQFWVHRTCLFYPHTLKLRIHEHDLKLMYSLPKIYYTFTRHCTVCKEKIIQRYWVYFCGRCGYFVHLKCAIGSLEAEKFYGEIQDVVEDEADSYGLVQLPLLRRDMVLDLVREYQPRKTARIREIKDEENDGVNENENEDSMIRHWSHKEHPLFLLEEFQEDINGFEIDDEMLVCN